PVCGHSSQRSFEIVCGRGEQPFHASMAGTQDHVNVRWLACCQSMVSRGKTSASGSYVDVRRDQSNRPLFLGKECRQTRATVTGEEGGQLIAQGLWICAVT